MATGDSPFDLSNYDAAVFDLDGTVWLSGQPIPGAVEFLDKCRHAGLVVAFATNATALEVSTIEEMLDDCGLGRTDDHVFTGGSVVASSIAKSGVTEVIAVVPPAMRLALEWHGIRVFTPSAAVASEWSEPQCHRALVMAASRSVSLGEIELVGRLATHAGHPLYVTSLDMSFPSLHGLEPGGGMLVAAARALYPIEPIVLGKPSREYAAAIVDQLGDLQRIVMFGDSQRADMGIAALLGADGVFVTGPSRNTVSSDLSIPAFVTDHVGSSIRRHAE